MGKPNLLQRTAMPLGPPGVWHPRVSAPCLPRYRHAPACEAPSCSCSCCTACPTRCRPLTLHALQHGRGRRGLHCRLACASRLRRATRRRGTGAGGPQRGPGAAARRGAAALMGGTV